MTSVVNLGCCPCCKLDSCLSGDTIDTGCCLACDDLIMWSERPAFSITQRFYVKAQPTCYPGNTKFCPNSEEILSLGAKYNCTPNLDLPGCSGDLCDTNCYELSECPSNNCDAQLVGKIINYTVSAEELEPVQTVYRFYETYWRPVGFYSGGYPVHLRNNTNPVGVLPNFHRRALSKQLPIIQDPNMDGEVISGKLARCRYESLKDSDLSGDKLFWWQETTGTYRVQSCLGFESPCSKSVCGTFTGGSSCTPEEAQSFCGSFTLDYGHIIDDLKRGYSFSGELNSGQNCCYPICDPPGCIVNNPPFCECDSYWMTKYRRRKLLDNYRHIWGVDIECYNDDDFAESENTFLVQNPGTRNYIQEYDESIGPPIFQTFLSFFSDRSFRLADHWLFNMHFERWWKIGKETSDGLTQSFWNMPGTSGDKPNPTQTTPPNPNPYPYQVDNLVPKWWIYACSGVPVFQFEIEDAILPMNTMTPEQTERRSPSISSDEYELFRQFRNNTELFYAEYSLQNMWESMGDAGYFQSKDWREEQLQIYRELNDRFPNAGYSSYANKTLDQLPELGPFRKRYYPNHEIATALVMRKPYLRPNLVPKSCLHLQAECFIPYPGDFPNPSMTQEQRDKAISDYYYWAERQWVYFRGVPAGWTWASWDAMLTCPCTTIDCEGGQPAPNEDAAILAGCGRAKGNCIESWFNQPQISYTKNNPENNTCVKTGGDGVPVECVIDGIKFDNLDACGCCITNCDFKYPSGCTTDNQNGGPIINEECEACYENCYSGSCYSEIPVEQCLVSEGQTGNTNGSGVGLDVTEDGEIADGFCGCAATPLLGCPSNLCSKVSISAYCGGVHIVAVQYATENKMEVKSTCFSDTDTINSYYRCLWTANTYLTPARNLYEYSQSQKKCISSSNIDMFSYWPDVKNTHVVPQGPICNNHLLAISGGCIPAYAEQYKVVPACETGICWPWFSETTRCDGEPWGCLIRMPCVSLQHGKQWDGRNMCPPACGSDLYSGDGDTGGPTESSCERDAFIGYTPECDINGRSVDI